jgi:hypothetical protein
MSIYYFTLNNILLAKYAQQVLSILQKPPHKLG